VYDNLVSNTHGIQLFARDASGQWSASQLNIKVDGNAFDAVKGVTVAQWGQTSRSVVSYKTVPDFKRGAHVGSGNGSAVGNTSAQPLPSDIAKQIGKAAGTRHVGAF